MADDLAQTISAHVSKARDKLGITQEEASELIGITVEYYARIERGQSLPSLRVFAQIAIVLGVSADILIGRDESPLRANFMPPRWFEQNAQQDSKQLRRLIRRLRRVPPEVVAAMDAVLRQIERLLPGHRKKPPSK